jgi:hypothetical protein
MSPHDAARALEAKVSPRAEPELLSLYGAFHLVLVVAAARDNQRSDAHRYLDTARTIAEQLGEDRNDFGTEFGATNVAIHSVSIAVELGDAGQAIDLSRHVDAGKLSPERQSRYLLDLARAHAMRRQIGEALRALLDAERIAPEETRVHDLGRAVTRDLLQLAGPRPRAELRDLAERSGVLHKPGGGSSRAPGRRPLEYAAAMSSPNAAVGRAQAVAAARNSAIIFSVRPGSWYGPTPFNEGLRATTSRSRS